MADDTIPWIEKYRAKNLSDIINHDEDIKIIENLIENKSLINMLFYGEPGTGKTSMILAIARKLYGDEYKSYIKEINASSDRGIDVIRTCIKDYVKLKSKKLKLIILDEIDAMTPDAQSALRGIIDDYSRYNRFCLICNNIEKIIPALKSRCLPFKFSVPSQDLIYGKLKMITSLEEVLATDESLEVLANSGKDFRQIINLLQGIANLVKKETITKDQMEKYLHMSIDKYESAYYDLKHNSFIENWNKIRHEIKCCGFDLQGFILYIFDIMSKEGYSPEMPFLLSHISKIDCRIKNGGNIEINLAYLISIFIKIR